VNAIFATASAGVFGLLFGMFSFDKLVAMALIPDEVAEGFISSAPP
jgi:hypothetical protein